MVWVCHEATDSAWTTQLLRSLQAGRLRMSGTGPSTHFREVPRDLISFYNAQLLKVASLSNSTISWGPSLQNRAFQTTVRKTLSV